MAPFSIILVGEFCVTIYTLCSFFAGQGHIQEIPNISRPGQVEKGL